jgi:hypothetical protein
VPSVGVAMDGLNEQISEKKEAAPLARPFGVDTKASASLNEQISEKKEAAPLARPFGVDTKASASRLQSAHDLRPGRQSNVKHQRKHTSSL